MMEPNIRSGNICTNESGRLGIVERFVPAVSRCVVCGDEPGQAYYEGRNVDDDQWWWSWAPTKVAETLADYQRGNRA